MMCSGIAGASALKMVSMIVMGYVIHMRMAAGLSALTTRPGGNMMSSARNWPSLMGRSSAEVRHLNAT